MFTDLLHSSKLYAPGRMMHFIEHREKHGCGTCSESSYSVVWAPRDNFQHIFISSSAVSDHMPYLLPDAINLPSPSVTALPDVRIDLDSLDERTPVLRADASEA